MAKVRAGDLLSAPPPTDPGAYPELAPPKPGSAGALLGAPNPAWSDESIPAEARLGGYLRDRAQARSGWEEVSGEAKRLFGADPAKIRRTYELETARELVRGRGEGEGLLGYVARRSLPFGSAGLNWLEAGQYDEAVERFKAGKATDTDIGRIANYEEMQRARGQEGIGESLVSTAASLPAMLGEALVGGRAITAGAKGLGLRAATQAQAPLLSRAGLAQQGLEVAKTPLMPSMYLAQAQQRANEQGGEWYDAKNLGPTGAYAMLQVGVLGHMNRVGNAAGKSLLRRGAEKTGFAYGEQQAGDAAVSLASEFLPKDYALKETRYGSLAKLARGEEGGTKEFLGQLLTFAAFAGWSAKGGLKAPAPAEVLDAGVKAIDDAARRGQPKDAALEAGVEAAKATVADVLPPEARPDDPLAELTPDHLKLLMPSLKAKTQKEVRETLLKIKPEVRQQWIDAVLGRDPEVEARKPEVNPQTPDAGGDEQQERGPAATSGAPRRIGGRNSWIEDPGGPAPIRPPAPNDTAAGIKAGFDQLAGGIDEASRIKDAKDIAEKGYVGFRRPEAADLFEKRHPDWVRTVENGETRFRPPDAAAPPRDATARDLSRLNVLAELANVKSADDAAKLLDRHGDDALAGMGIRPDVEVPMALRQRGIDPAEVNARRRPPAQPEPTPPAPEPALESPETADRPPEAPPAAPTPEVPAARAVGPQDEVRAYLRRRIVEDGDLTAVDEVEGLTEKERHVARETLAGRTFEEIAADPQMAKKGGGAVSRQRAQQVEKAVREKLGLSHEDVLAAQAQQRVERALDLAARGRRVSVTDLGADPADAARKLSKAERLERKRVKAADDAVDEWIKRVENAKPEDRAKLDADLVGEIARLEGRGEAAGRGAAGDDRPAAEGTEPAGRGAPAAEEVAPAKKKVGAGLRRKKEPAAGASLARAVIDAGGIDPESAEFLKHFESVGVARANEPALRRPGLFRKGGRGLDQIAQELHAQGHLPDADPQTLVDMLLAKKESAQAAGDQDRAGAAYERRVEAMEEREKAAQTDLFGRPVGKKFGKAGGAQLTLDDLSREAWTQKAREWAVDNEKAVEAWSASGTFKADGEWYRVGKAEDGYPVTKADAGPEDVVGPARGPAATAEELFGDDPFAVDNFGRPLTDAERGGLVGGGQPDAGETARPLRESALANAKIDEERKRLGMAPLMAPARRTNPEVWDAAMARLDADPGLGARLVTELLAKSRATTVEENALLLHREVALKNEHERAMLQFVNAMKAKAGPADLDRLDARERELMAQLNEVHQVARTTGTEWGRAGQFRRQLAREDFTLSGMLRRATAARGEPLTPAERVEVTAQFQKIDAAEKALEAAGGEDKAAPDQRIAARKAKGAFAEKMAGYREARRPLVFRALRRAGEVQSFARALITSGDLGLSALLRQGGFFALTRPVKAYRAAKEGLRSFFSEAEFDRAQDELRQRPNAALYEQAGLYLADADGRPTAQEEAFLGRASGLVGKARKYTLVNATERGYTATLNRLRADVFDSLVAGLTRNGRPTPEEAKGVANLVNVATGRATLGRVAGYDLDAAARAGAYVFFSPRYFVSRLQLLAGQPFYGQPRTVQKAVAKEYARALLGVGVFYGLMSLANDDESITFDPRSSDFGKVKLGKTRVDPLMGLAQPIVFASRMAAGESKSTKTGGTYDLRGDRPGRGHDAGDVFERFWRSKLAPVPGAAGDVFFGEDVIGQKTRRAAEVPGLGRVEDPNAGAAVRIAGDLTVPFVARDVLEVMQEEGLPRGAALSLLALLGMGVNVHERRGR